MILIFGDEFIFYPSSMYEICLHCHWLGFPSFILNFGQCEGWGTEFGTGGKIIYVGDWRKGKRHGHGTHTEYSKENGKPCQRYVGKF